MFNFKKKLAVALSGVLTLAMLAPAAVVPSVAKAAEDESPLAVVVSVDEYAVKATLSGVKKVYIDTMKGTAVKDTDSYKVNDAKVVDLIGFSNGKATELEVYSKADKSDKIAISIAKQDKIKASYNPIEKKLVIKKGSEDLEVSAASISVNGVGVEVDPDGTSTVLDGFVQKGATGIVVMKPTAVKADGKWTVTPVSKEAKFKIPAQKKGPAVKVVSSTISFKLPKGCSYILAKTDAEGEETATYTSIADLTKGAEKAEVIDITKVVSDGSLKTNNYVLQVWKAPTAKAAQSKVTEVIIPTQSALVSPDAFSTASALNVTENIKGAVNKGIKIENKSSVDYEVALVKDADNIDLLAKEKDKKVKFVKIAAGKTKAFSVKQLKDKVLIARIAGQDAKKGKTPKDLVLPSEITSYGAVTLSEAPKKALTVAAKQSTVTGESIISVTGDVKDAASYVYVIDSKNVKTVNIGLKKADLTGAVDVETASLGGFSVKIDAKKYVTVYALDSAGSVIAFGCSQVKAADIK